MLIHQLHLLGGRHDDRDGPAVVEPVPPGPDLPPVTGRVVRHPWTIVVDEGIASLPAKCR